MDEASKQRRLEIGARIVLLLAVVALWATRLAGPLDLRWDAGVYYVTGVSLAEGRGYRLLNEPGEIAAVQYPPGLPVTIAAAIRLLGTNDPDVVAGKLRLVWFLLAVLHAQLAYSIVRRWLAPLSACGAALLATIAFPTWFYADLLFAELPMAVLADAFLLVSTPRAALGRTLVAGSLGAAAFLFRTLGIALLCAWVAQSVLERRWKMAALRVALAAIPFLGWKLYVRGVERSDEYLHPAYEYQRAPYVFHNVSYEANLGLADPFAPEAGTATASVLAQRAWSNVLETPRRVGEALSTSDRKWTIIARKAIARPPPRPAAARAGSAWPPRSLVHGALAAVGLLALLGMAVAWRRGARIEVLTIGCVLAVLWATPWPEQYGRYLMPFVGILAGGLVASWRVFAGEPRATLVSRSRRAIAGVAALGFCGGQVVATIDHFDERSERPVRMSGPTGAGPGARLFFYGGVWIGLDESIEWLRTRVARDDVIACVEAHYAWLRTGAKSVMPPFHPDPAEASRLLDTVPARFVVIDQLRNLDVGSRYAAPAVVADPQRWQLVFTARNGTSQVYERRR